MENNNVEAQPRTIQFDFHGDGFEYFKIWIVNVLLTILTLGIYSAWAKVRNNRYFYSNLYLDGYSFAYLASPIAILKGRLIAVGAFIAYSFLAQLYPVAGGLMLIALLFAIPYLIVRSLAFNNRMSAYKNVQFRFHGRYGEAYMVYYVWPLIGIVTLGIMLPYARLKLNQFVVGNSAYGTTRFDFNATYRDYGVIYLAVVGMIFAIGVVVAFSSVIAPELPMVVALLGFLAIAVYSERAVTNLYYNSATLLGHGFSAELSMAGLAQVYLINLALTIVTLGLYLPAAKVRVTRYITGQINFIANGSLDDFTASEQESVSALGEEFGEVFDFDIGTF